MAFWDWERWEKEIDWMALHGVNLPLAITGTETVWYNVLQKLGYNKTEINEFISGPGFFAWWLMNNLEGKQGDDNHTTHRDRKHSNLTLLLHCEAPFHNIPVCGVVIVALLSFNLTIRVSKRYHHSITKSWKNYMARQTTIQWILSMRVVIRAALIWML